MSLIQKVRSDMLPLSLFSSSVPKSSVKGFLSVNWYLPFFLCNDLRGFNGDFFAISLKTFYNYLDVKLG